VDQLIDTCDIIVEAAAQEAVEEHGPRILSANRDLLVLSVGAFADDGLLTSLKKIHGGKLIISTGAVGGIDLLRAAALSRGLETVRLTTTKPPIALLDADQSGRALEAQRSGQPVTVFEGSARDVATRFPASTNVAATIGLSTLGMDRVDVRLIADPTVIVVVHRLQASGPIGAYDISIENHPSENPRTSSITAYAALRALIDTRAHVIIS
jgi:aspartate dehydrogenase